MCSLRMALARDERKLRAVPGQPAPPVAHQKLQHAHVPMSHQSVVKHLLPQPQRVARLWVWTQRGKQGMCQLDGIWR